MTWMMPTYGRPALCQACLNACAETGMTEPGLLYVRERVPGEYASLHVPDNWRRIDSELEMADTMRDTFRRHPNAPYYGWLSDDTHPRTPHWDVRLAEAAGRWNLADCEDLFLAGNPDLRSGSLTSGFCWGGDLVRLVGWWALPGVRQAGIDDAWVYLILNRNPHLRVHLSDVVVEHLSWRNEKRLRDETDSWVRDEVEYIERDLELQKRWRKTPEADGLARRIREMAE